MSNEIKEIAQRMKALREIDRLTQQEMAEQLDIPAADYILYEDGETDIPISVLLKISEKFKVEFTALVTARNQYKDLHWYVTKRS